MLAGARARALAQGYRIEEINVRDPALSSARLTEILLRRGVRGGGVAPLHSIRERVVLDWAQFSAVAIGYSLQSVPLSRVSRPPFIAGIEQDCPQLGAAAVDPVIGMLHRNEAGPPPKPLTLLLDGTGIPGRPLRPLTAPAPAARSPRPRRAPAPA